MHEHVIARQMAGLLGSLETFFSFNTQSTWARRRFEPGVADFVLGNPHEMPLAGFADALQRWSAPQDKDWFAYKLSERPARTAVAATLTRRTGLDWDPEDVFMTNGGFAAIAVSLRAILEPGDEVIFLSPPWFFYEILILAAGGVRSASDVVALGAAGARAAVVGRALLQPSARAGLPVPLQFGEA